MRTCNNCSGNGGFFDRANGERYLSDPKDGTQWQMCSDCDGIGLEKPKMAHSKNGRRKTDAQEAASVEAELNALIDIVRRREAEDNFVDCEAVVKATVMVVGGSTAAEALAECGVQVGGNNYGSL